jgi:hypothetical protein
MKPFSYENNDSKKIEKKPHAYMYKQRPKPNEQTRTNAMTTPLTIEHANAILAKEFADFTHNIKMMLNVMKDTTDMRSKMIYANICFQYINGNTLLLYFSTYKEKYRHLKKCMYEKGMEFINEYNRGVYIYMEPEMLYSFMETIYETCYNYQQFEHTPTTKMVLNKAIILHNSHRNILYRNCGTYIAHNIKRIYIDRTIHDN